MKGITPDQLRCSDSIACPAIFEITPAHLKCTTFSSCPAVYEVEMKDITPEHLSCGGDLLIIGKKPGPEFAEQLKGKVGDDEVALIIAREFFSELK